MAISSFLRLQNKGLRAIMFGLAFSFSGVQASMAQTVAVARDSQPERTGGPRIDSEFFLETPPNTGVPMDDGTQADLICQNNTQTGCFVELASEDEHHRCREDFIRAFGDDGAEYRIDMNKEVFVPVRQQAMRTRRDAGVDTSYVSKRVEGAPIASNVPVDVVKQSAFKIRWECGRHEENQLSYPAPPAADFIQVKHFATYIYFRPYLWRPEAAEIGNLEQGEYVANRVTRSGVMAGQSCDEPRAVIFGKGNREVVLSQGVRQLVEVNSSLTNTQARWSCGNRQEMRTISFPKGTDALDVEFTREDANAFGSAKRIKVQPVAWRSFWREMTEEERLAAEQVREQKRTAAMIQSARQNNMGLAAIQALNGNREFPEPKINGVRLDACRVWGNECGQPAADAFCRLEGFDKAVALEWDKNIGRTWVMGDASVCDDPNCDGFRTITCGPN